MGGSQFASRSRWGVEIGHEIGWPSLGERLDGETLLDGLPKSSRREWNRKMTFVPAGHRFYGWQKPRSLLRSTFLYIDPRSSLLSELRFAEVEFRP